MNWIKDLEINLSKEQREAASRFNECAADGQEHDVSPELISELENLGLIINKGNNFYEQTDLMKEFEESNRLVKIIDQNCWKDEDGNSIKFFDMKDN
jgi:calcineurin-like phosphoesterase